MFYIWERNKNEMKLPKIIEQKFDKLIVLCQKFGVKRLYAFGSVVGNKFDIANASLSLMYEN